MTLPQADIFFDQLKHHGSPMYNVGGYIQLGDVDVQRLREAHRDLVESCDIFGLRVVANDAGVFQYCSGVRDHALELIDLSAEPAPGDAADAWLRRLFEQPLPYEDAPLFRAYLVKLGDADHRYVGVAHHMMMDGWGFRNWGRVLATLYAGGTVHQPLADWIEVSADDRAYLASPRFEHDRTYWLGQSGERRFLPAHHGAAGAGTAGGRVVAPIPADAMSALHAVARETGAGVGTVLTHLVGMYLARSYGQRSLVIGVPVHNRRNRAHKEMLGVFASITPVGIDFPADATWRDGIAELAKQQRRNLRHQRFPLGELVSAYAGTAPTSDAPFDVLVNYLALPGDLRFGGSPARLVYVPNHHEKSTLAVTLWQDGDLGAAELQLDYHSTHFRGDEARALVRRLIAMIEPLPGQLDARIGAVDLLPPGEREQVVRGWNATAAAYPSERCIHQLFEAQAARTPASPALVCGDARLSYGELDAAANRVAHGLRARGVGPDVVVGLCMERSVEMVVGLWGILKAGGA
ncbi:MAG TPA: condensation domain-containing protein, partial [Kofleriaceae bacterium]